MYILESLSLDFSLAVLVPLPLELCCEALSPIPFSFSKAVNNNKD